MPVTRSVSVIICTCNRAHLLPGVISQLQAQTYPPDAFEIIVVGNTSTDHTMQVVERLATEGGVPVHYVCEPRSGVTFPRNRGAEVARYPYLAYVDDDCSLEPNWLQQLMRGFDLHERVLAVGGQVLVCWDQGEKTSWLIPGLERWFGANRYLGTHPRLLGRDERIIECNMALERRAWQAAGGFLGTDQFGCPLGCSEVVYLLEQLHRQGGKVAFIPEAVIYHHIGKRTRGWMLQRAYWQGVSDSVLDNLLKRRSLPYKVYQLVLNVGALFVLAAIAGGFSLMLNEGQGMFHLARAVRRLGLTLGELHLVGDWPRVHAWLSERNPSQ